MVAGLLARVHANVETRATIRSSVRQHVETSESDNQS